jgi:hypothetical protein
MRKFEAIALETYFNNGYLIIINDTMYVDSLVMGIYEDEETGEIVYDSETFSGRELREVDLSQVIIASPVKNMVTKTGDIEIVSDPEDYHLEKVDGKDI